MPDHEHQTGSWIKPLVLDKFQSWKVLEGSLRKVLMERRDWRGGGRVVAEKTRRGGLNK
jgi:hypothetical protein